MKLEDILKKNKHKVSKLGDMKMPLPPSVAMEDRPYNVDFLVEKQISNDKKVTKEVTNRKHIGNKTENKQVTNVQPTGNKISLPSQENEKAINKQVSEKVTNININRLQTDNINELKFPLARLVGIQRNLILFFYFLAKRNLSQSTNPVTLDYLSQSLNITKGVIKTTIIRLQKKGCISRHGGKEGRGGWSSFTIGNELYQDIMQQERLGVIDSFSLQAGNQQVTKQVSEKGTNVLSSSSFNKINITTTTTEALPESWTNIDITPLKNLGFGKYHIVQLYKRNILDPDIIQDSIYAFAFDLKHNGKQNSIKGDVLNFFMGILSRGRPYAKPSNYESPEDEALRKYVEEKTNQIKAKQDLENKAKEVSLQEWLDALSEQELFDFYIPTDPPLDSLPEKMRITLKRRNSINNATLFFESEVWPSKRKKILSDKNQG